MNTTASRLNMVNGQLRPNKVNNPQLLAQFTSLPRENFTSAAARAHAYLDQPTPIEDGREMFAPMVAARLIQALDLTPQSCVLVLAGGSGYSAAVIAGLAGQVTMVEDDAVLVAEAHTNLANVRNVRIEAGNPAIFTPSQPLDAILVDAPFTALPNLASLAKHLVEGGKLAGVRTSPQGLMEAVILTKHGKSLVEEVLFETKGTPHPAFTAEAAFVF
ncbi:MAG: hypothetical protein GC129_04075 [Proteobacteria bacterium]|nr:hypothetical protein [Pseudomonadota bacterium]